MTRSKMRQLAAMAKKVGLHKPGRRSELEELLANLRQPCVRAAIRRRIFA